MNWFCESQKETQPVFVTTWGESGLGVVIDGKRYHCPDYNPKAHTQLNALIKAKAWGKAKQLLKSWNCRNLEVKQPNQIALF